jgi:hypothetical protein
MTVLRIVGGNLLIFQLFPYPRDYWFDLELIEGRRFRNYHFWFHGAVFLRLNGIDEPFALVLVLGSESFETFCSTLALFSRLLLRVMGGTCTSAT